MNGGASYEIIWEFDVDEDQRLRFEAAYGPTGEWAQLFKRATGYIETRLLADDERANVYLTIDRWLTREHFERFKLKFADDYEELDRRLETVAGVERRIGAYNCSTLAEIRQPRIAPA